MQTSVLRLFYFCSGELSQFPGLQVLRSWYVCIAVRTCTGFTVIGLRRLRGSGLLTGMAGMATVGRRPGASGASGASAAWFHGDSKVYLLVDESARFCAMCSYSNFASLATLWFTTEFLD